MGSIRRFNLSKIIAEYDTLGFFETGTFWGDGVDYALGSPFRQLLSVEVVPEIAEKARARFAGIPQVEIIEDSSEKGLADRAASINYNCVFWLDAHYPGADAGMNAYDKDMDEAMRLPLAREIETIYRLRKAYQDVIIIDDLRIYEDGPFANGNVPADALPGKDRNINFVFKHFRWSHVIIRSYLDEGYILLFPRWKYYRKLISNIADKSKRGWRAYLS